MSITKEDWQLERREEFEIEEQTEQAIAALLMEAFPGYPARSFFRQVPAFRYLCWQGERLAAHMGVDFRMVNAAGTLIRAFGVVDLCVHPGFQQRKMASAMLKALTELGRKARVGAILLTASDQQLYLGHGFEKVDNRCTWMMISGDKTLGVVSRGLGGGLMVKPLNGQPWPDGPVDFLGPAF